jgi:hypothetical protein
MDSVTTQDSQLALMNNGTATTGVFASGVLHLYTTAVPLSSQTSLTDMVEATFNGYNAVNNQAFRSSYIDEGGGIVITAPSVQFKALDSSKPETVYGWYLTDASVAKLTVACQLDTPVPMAAANDGVTIEPEIKYGN